MSIPANNQNDPSNNMVTSLEQSLETASEKKRRIISVFVCHVSMFLSGFGNSLIYIGMYPYLIMVSSVYPYIN